MNSSSIHARLRAAAVVAAIAACMSGCYELQAAIGQADVMLERKPIARVIADPATPPALRGQLEQVSAIRDFATRELGLPDNGSYRSYADVGRPYVVWNVFAAPEFSVQPKEWCYPIVGCVAYRGYFAERRAQAFAARLREQGFDVAVGGVAAYSTLGHFDDPVLSTMMGWNDTELAAIIFHELTHQLLYVAGDASFNEALATVVEDEGVRRWLLSQGRERDLDAWLEEQRRYRRVTDLLIETRAKLAAIYASGIDPVAMRARKDATFAAARADYEQLNAAWGGRAPFSHWFKGAINNADLVSIATYERCVPGFERELAAVGGDLGRFFARVRELARMKQDERDAIVCTSD
jgi:predicted aminopeptidase